MAYKRGGAPRPVAAMVGPLTREAFRKRGFSAGDVVADWSMIVGNLLAGTTAPEKIALRRDGPGVLHLRAASGASALEIQHLEPQIVERVNTYYGYRAISRLRIIQGPLPRKRLSAKVLPSPTPHDATSIENLIEGVDDEELKERLRSLGRAVAVRNPLKTR